MRAVSRSSFRPKSSLLIFPLLAACAPAMAVMGGDTQTTTDAVCNQQGSGVACGNGANAFGANTTAVGTQARATQDNATAYGGYSSALGTGSTAMGVQATGMRRLGKYGDWPSELRQR